MCLIFCALCIGAQAGPMVLGAAAALATQLAVPAAIAVTSFVGNPGLATAPSIQDVPVAQQAVVSTMRSTGSTFRWVESSITRTAPAATRPTVSRAFHPVKTLQTVIDRAPVSLPRLR